MKTKNLIKRRSITLFNKNGVRNVTLRDLAKALNKSYGNITYHFATKEELLKEIFYDLIQELNKIQNPTLDNSNGLRNYIKISELNFSFLKKYYFLLVDKRDIQSNYTELFKLIDFQHLILISKRKFILLQLQEQGLLKKNLTSNVFDFIIDLTMGLTMTFFQDFQSEDYLEKKYLSNIKKILFPYLTDKGKLMYIKC